MTEEAGRRGYRAVNRKAERKLDFVVEKLMRSAGEDPCSATASEPLARTFDLRCCSEAGAITVRYCPRSKLFAILYDLCFKFSVAGPGVPGCTIEMVPGATRLAVRGVDSESHFDPFSDKGDVVDLIADRLGILDVTRLRAVYEAPSSSWTVSFSTMVGSATWNLIPPVMHLIEPTAIECVRAIELLRLLAVSLGSDCSD